VNSSRVSDNSSSFGGATKLPPTLVASLFRLANEFAKFGLVGLFALIIDLGLFNALAFAGSGPLGNQPLTAKTVSVVVATTASYAANRHWTWRDRPVGNPRREVAAFAIVNVFAMGIALGCLYVSHYLMGFTSAVDDNLSANVLGLALGMVFRFWAYRTFVFPVELAPGQPVAVAVA
jgi:putative flippase GtrA